MRVLALDISTCTGWALLEGEPGQLPKIVDKGIVTAYKLSCASYPWNFYLQCVDVASLIYFQVERHNPDLVVIEETNMGRSRYTQKRLEWIHGFLLKNLSENKKWSAINPINKVVYINTSDWRRKLGATLTKEDKKLNAKVRALKKAGNKEGLRALGVRGKIGKKHVAIRYVNQTFGLQLRAKDDDIADAICEGCAWFLGVQICDGK
jgi:Holliday junction resolvasome RuvABC endonuclease subunit